MRIVLCTCEPGDGARLLTALLDDRLVAGGNIIPGLRSLYRWEGAIQDEPEELLVMETADDRVEAMTARLRALHPYEVPKIVTFDVKETLADYLQWVREMTRPAQGAAPEDR